MQEKILEAFNSKMGLVSKEPKGSILDMEGNIKLMLEMNICRVVPMTSTDFVTLLGQKEPIFHADGFLIENLMKKGNIEGFEGYITWVNKNELEMIPIDDAHLYEELPTYTLRLHKELSDLNDKIEKLAQFLLKLDAKTVTLDSKQSNLLRQQLIAMTDYQMILKQRISA